MIFNKGTELEYSTCLFSMCKSKCKWYYSIFQDHIKITGTLCYTWVKDSQGSLEENKGRPKILHCEICTADYECWYFFTLEGSSGFI